MTNNLNYFIEKKYGKKKNRHFATLLWPEIRCDTDNKKIALSGKIKRLCDSDPETLSYGLLLRIGKLLDLTEIDKLWLPIENN